MNIVITAGGTNERIDDVRFITNMSSGRLGSEIANTFSDKFFKEGSLKENTIFYIYAKGAILPEFATCIKFIPITDTRSVAEAVEKVITENRIDFFIHSMAISDYTVDKVFTMNDIIKSLIDKSILDKSILLNNEDTVSDAINSITGINKETKISSNNNEMFISMKKTPKIIDMIKKLDKNIFLISFKLLVDVSRNVLIETAQKQLERTNSDIVIANDLKRIREGSHQAMIISKTEIIDVENKNEIANEIVKIIGKGK